MALAPLAPLSSIGFAPESPRELGQDHALYHRIAVDPVSAMPSIVTTFGYLKVTSEKEFNGALQQALANAHMETPAGETPRFRLAVSYLNVSAPPLLAFSNHATARFHYELRRVDTGQMLFSRAIETTAETHGGDGTERLVGTARMAILANVASAVLCLDKAAYGRAPTDCALSPTGGFTIPGTRDLMAQGAGQRVVRELNSSLEKFTKDCPAGARARLRGVAGRIDDRGTFVCRDAKEQDVPWASPEISATVADASAAHVGDAIAAALKQSATHLVDPTDLPKARTGAAKEISLIVRINVAADGVPNGCQVTVPSGYPAFDARLCDLAVAKLRYEPARTNGVPQAATVDQKFHFVLPGP